MEKSIKPKQIRNSPLKGLTPEERKERRRLQYAAYYERNRADKAAESCFRMRKLMQERPWSGIVKGCLNRARSRGLPYDEDLMQWAETRWTGRCELTGVPFRSNRGVGAGPGPFSPSIDRIEATKGYTKENCRFILYGINGMKSSGTDREAFTVAKAWVLSELGRVMSPPMTQEALDKFFPSPPHLYMPMPELGEIALFNRAARFESPGEPPEASELASLTSPES